MATIKRWPLSSLHPFGHLERELGDIGNIEIETEALLADNNVTTTAFGEKVEKCLPELPWVIPEKELSRRRDLRQSCTFTIDPATAKDLDDAVSCNRLEDGTFEIGVHIADVSHFIKVGSALDREAKSRATTVYLVQKAIPMLPNVLCEDLCSLTANVERLTFSVFWKMSEDGEVLNTWFSKSVIRSCAQLSYDDAQRVITSGSLDPKVEVFDHPRSLVEDNIKTFFVSLFFFFFFIAFSRRHFCLLTRLVFTALRNSHKSSDSADSTMARFRSTPSNWHSRPTRSITLWMCLCTNLRRVTA